MAVSDLVFLLFTIYSGLSLVSAGVFAIRRRAPMAQRIVGIWLISAAVYLLVSVGVSFFRPQAIKAVREPWCFDDWCLTVERTRLVKTSVANIYTIDLLIHSAARRVDQRANGAWIYLIDGRGRRFIPDLDPTAVPLDILLRPQQSITTALTFHLPPDTRAVGVVTGHGGPYCGPMNFLVIGDSGCLFHKPPMIRIE